MTAMYEASAEALCTSKQQPLAAASSAEQSDKQAAPSRRMCAAADAIERSSWARARASDVTSGKTLPSRGNLSGIVPPA